MRHENPSYPNFFNKDDPAFTSFQATLNNLFKSLRKDGIGAEASRAETITPDEEDTLWETGVLNIDTPKAYFVVYFTTMESAFVSVVDRSTETWD